MASFDGTKAAWLHANAGAVFCNATDKDAGDGNTRRLPRRICLSCERLVQAVIERGVL